MDSLREITLNEWEQKGEGGSAKTYIKKDDNSRLLKVFNTDVALNFIQREFIQSKNVLELGLSTPRVLEEVRIGEQYGIIYENIVDKISLSKYSVNKDFEGGARMLGREARILHSTQCDTSLFKDKALVFYSVIENCKWIDSSSKEKLLKLINSTPNTTTCLHGDLSSGNMIYANGKCYWIDLADFGYGNPYYDLGMIYFSMLGQGIIGKYLNELLHMKPKVRAQFWDYFIREYLQTENNKEIQEFTKIIKPYSSIAVAGLGTQKEVAPWVFKLVFGGQIKRFLK